MTAFCRNDATLAYWSMSARELGRTKGEGVVGARERERGAATEMVPVQFVGMQAVSIISDDRDRTFQQRWTWTSPTLGGPGYVFSLLGRVAKITSASPITIRSAANSVSSSKFSGR